MTLLFFDGMTNVDLAAKPEWLTPFVGTNTGRDGYTNGAAQSGGAVGRIVALPTAAATCIMGVACDLLNLTGSTCPIQFMSDASTIQLVLTVNTSGIIEVRKTSASGTLLGTATHTALTAGVWHHYQMKGTLSTTSANVEVRLDGVTVLTLTGVVTSTVTGNVTHVRMQPNSGTGNTLFDDLWVCDAVDATATQGRPNNDFLGDLRVAVMSPTAAGDSTQWTPSAGANWAAVDENPPSMANYVQDNVSGHRDLYQVTDLLGTSFNIYAIRPSMWLVKTDAGTVTVKPCIKENGTLTYDTTLSPPSGAGVPVYLTTRYVKPSNGAVFLTSDIDSLQIGQEIA